MDKTDMQPLSWSAPEYIRKERSTDWYWTLGLIALIGAGVAIYFGNYLFGVFIVLSGIVLIFFNMREPRTVNFEIRTEGIKVGNRLYEYKAITGFAIKDKTLEPKLLVETKKYFLPQLTIPLPPESTEIVHETLKAVLPEIEINESQTLIFMEKLGL